MILNLLNSFRLHALLAALCVWFCISEANSAEPNFTEFEPSWQTELETYFSDTKHWDTGNFEIYRNGLDERLIQVEKIVSKDKTRGISDLILYFENIGAAVALFSEGNTFAASAYKAKALKHLNASIQSGLVEALIVEARLKIDGLFGPHDYYDGLNTILSLSGRHSWAYRAIYANDSAGGLYSDYLNKENKKTIKDRQPMNPFFYTNEFLAFYMTNHMRQKVELTSKYGTNPMQELMYKIDPVPPYLDPFFEGAVFADCALFFLSEAEGVEVDAYRKMQTCAGGHVLDYKYFLAGLRKGIKNGQTHYLHDMGRALVFDDIPANDNEGAEYLKLGISYGHRGHYQLMHYYNFITGQIDKCQAVYDSLPREWKDYQELSFIIQRSNEPEGFATAKVILPYGCFKNIVRINGKKIKFKADPRGTAFRAVLSISEKKLKEQCFEFVNARVEYHPEFSISGSVIGSEQIAFCD